MGALFHIEIGRFQKNHNGERICGDVFLSKRIPDQGRVLSVLSDGMGHGVKANILATLTATMGIRFMEEHKDAEKLAELVMKALPICSERKMSYSTFTIVDIQENGEVTLLEYENPRTLILRGIHIFDPGWDVLEVKCPGKENTFRGLHTCKFRASKEDRIIFCSDGITQSGLGSDKYLLGWGRENFVEYAKETVLKDRSISASNLSQRIVNKAVANDLFSPKDDTSCGVVYFREARKLIICTGPPIDETKDAEFAGKCMQFMGKKIVCGATTSSIISREYNLTIDTSYESTDPSLPPISSIEGIDLVTEGALTLSKVYSILQVHSQNMHLGEGPADAIVEIMLENDDITFLVGTRINQMHHIPNFPNDIEIRKNLIRKIAEILDTKFFKKIVLEFM